MNSFLELFYFMFPFICFNKIFWMASSAYSLKVSRHAFAAIANKIIFQKLIDGVKENSN